MIEPPRGMYPSRVDDKGRLKLPATFAQYFGAIREKTLYVTSLDRRIAQLYPMEVWRHNEKVLEEFEDRAVANRVAFNAADLGSECEVDSQGRVLLSPELRRELGIENAAVKLFGTQGHVEVLSEQMYEERKADAAQVTSQQINTLKGLR